MYTIIRNNKEFGPYSLESIISSVEKGKILLSDKAYDSRLEQKEVHTVRYFFRLHGVKVKIFHHGTLWQQLRWVGSKLLLPKELSQRNTWTDDKRLLLLTIAGLSPLLLQFISLTDTLIFYFISLYFSVIWGLFFYYFFKTKQVQLRTTITVFFLSQIAVFIIFGLGLSYINPFYHLEKYQSLTAKATFFLLAVGLTEEITKAIPLFIIATRSREPLIPDTLVFYGLISGIAFGVYEGVQYQMTVNIHLDYAKGFFMNIARLTSLPFFHAILCALAGYFIGFAHLYPGYRKSLYFLAIMVPTLLHGLYDICTGSIIGTLLSIAIVFFAALLLTSYLKNDTVYQAQLRGQ